MRLAARRRRLMTEFLQNLVLGLLLGGVYALAPAD